VADIELADFKGIVTAPGLLARSQASCLDALNWEFPAPGVARKRRGFERLPGNAGGPVWAMLSSRVMGSNVFAHVGTAASATQVRFGDGSAGLTAIPTVDAGNLTRNPGNGLRMHLAVAQRNHYLTADEGVARVESDFAAGSPARYAGMPRGLGVGPLSPQVVPLAGAPFGNGYGRAYRITWHRKDADGVELGGAPTARWIVTNSAYTNGYTGGVGNFRMFIYVPKEVGTLNTDLTTSYFFRIWGTRTFLEASELGDDECYLLTERFLTAGEIAAGIIQFDDSTPDRFLLASPRLHTNLSNVPPQEAGIRQGVVNEDAPPPAANDVAYWADCMWYADVTQRPTQTVGLLALPADGDTVQLTANGVTVTLTFRLAPGVATDVQIVNTAPTTAINLRLTALQFASKVALNCIANGLDAYHVSTTSTEPGVVMLEQRKLNGTSISFVPSVPATWRPFGGVALSSTVSAVSTANALFFSKPTRADAVPPINVLVAGPAASRILRVYPYRERLIVFTDYGIYQVTGRSFADFAVYPLDTGFRLIGRDLVAECDDRLYAWCYEGIVEIDDGGVRVISTPIEPTIEDAFVTMANGASSPLEAGRNFESILGFAVAYRNQHQVRFHYAGPVSLGSMYQCAYWLSFDTRTRAWARGQYGIRSIGGFLDGMCSGVVRFSDDLLMTGSWSSGADTYLFRERRAYVAADFTDTNRAGASDPVVSTMRLQYQVPDTKGAQHWQQTVLNWDAEEVSWRTLPTSFAITHTTEDGSAASQTVAVSELATRIETPQGVRRGQRLAVTLVHDAIEYAGLVGVTQSYRDGTKFARRVTP
jgi:hypothetical protein